MRAQMRDAVARGVPGQLRRQLGRIIMGVPYILAPLDDRTAAVADQRRPAGTAARAVIVVEAQLIFDVAPSPRSEEHTSELQSLMRISYAVFCLKKKKKLQTEQNHNYQNP